VEEINEEIKVLRRKIGIREEIAANDKRIISNLERVIANQEAMIARLKKIIENGDRLRNSINN